MQSKAISMGLWYISLTISGLKPFYQAYKIMSLLICFNGQKRILEADETLALILL